MPLKTLQFGCARRTLFDHGLHISKCLLKCIDKLLIRRALTLPATGRVHPDTVICYRVEESIPIHDHRTHKSIVDGESQGTRGQHKVTPTATFRIQGIVVQFRNVLPIRIRGTPQPEQVAVHPLSLSGRHLKLCVRVHCPFKEFHSFRDLRTSPRLFNCIKSCFCFQSLTGTLSFSIALTNWTASAVHERTVSVLPL